LAPDLPEHRQILSDRRAAVVSLWLFSAVHQLLIHDVWTVDGQGNDLDEYPHAFVLLA